LGRRGAKKQGGVPGTPPFLFRFLGRLHLAAQEFLGEGGQLVVRRLSQHVQLHLRFGGLASAQEAFERSEGCKVGLLFPRSSQNASQSSSGEARTLQTRRSPMTFLLPSTLAGSLPSEIQLPKHERRKIKHSGHTATIVKGSVRSCSCAHCRQICSHECGDNQV
jgi:hypothetical protein